MPYDAAQAAKEELATIEGVKQLGGAVVTKVDVRTDRSRSIQEVTLDFADGRSVSFCGVWRNDSTAELGVVFDEAHDPAS